MGEEKTAIDFAKYRLDKAKETVPYAQKAGRRAAAGRKQNRLRPVRLLRQAGTV